MTKGASLGQLHSTSSNSPLTELAGLNLVIVHGKHGRHQEA